MSRHLIRRAGAALVPMLMLAAFAPVVQAATHTPSASDAGGADTAKPVESARARASTGVGPWASGGYRPKKGDWRAYVLSPHTRTVRPAAVQRVQARGGRIVGSPSSLLKQDGTSVQIVSTGDRTTSPLVTLDMGKEVAGPAQVRVTATSDPAPALHVCYSESMQYAAFAPSQNNGEAAYAPGCDTANIWNGFPGTAYTFDSDSHTLPLADTTLPATVTDPELRGGYRYVTLFLDGPGSIDVDSVATHFSAATGQKKLADYNGHFLSSDNTLNKIWYAGAYTVQLDTGASDTAKSWPYANGEGDHADAAVPGANPHQDVIYDGGKRDRDIWQGDLAVEDPATLVSTHALTAVRNSLTALASQQLEDGYVPAEGLVGQHNLDEERTYGEYVSWFVYNMADYYLWTGDTAYLRRWWPAVQKAAAWLEDQRDATGLIAFGPSGSCGHYGYSDCGHETYVNALYQRNLTQLATLATALGDRAGAATYTARAATVRSAINRQLWDGTVGAYRLSTEIPDVFPQDGNSVAVLTGVAGGRRATAALSYLRTHNWDTLGSLTVSPSTPTAALPSFYAPLPSWFEVDARLMSSDRSGALPQSGLVLMKRFWGWMLRQDPGSTFWEHVLPSGDPTLSQFSSLAHGWASGPTVSLTTQVLGVSPSTAGFETFSVAPHPGDLTWAQGVVPTPHGRITTSWTNSGGSFRLHVTAPKQTTADVTVPLAGRGVRVTVDGRTVWSRVGQAHAATYSGQHVVVSGLGAGAHTVSVQRLSAVKARATLSLSPATTTADRGDVVTLDALVNGVAPGRLQGTLTISAPKGWKPSARTLDVDLPSGGKPADHQYRFFVQVPAGATASGRVTVHLHAGPARATAATTIALGDARTLFDFEDGTTQGWTAGQNVSSVGAATSMANGPGSPYAGTSMLQAVTNAVGSAPRTISYTASTPLNLTAARTLTLHTDSYGGLPDADHYQLEVVVRGADGTDVDQTFTVSPDSWNTLSVDLSAWAGRKAISGIDVSFSAVGSTTQWSSDFQIDEVGWAN